MDQQKVKSNCAEGVNMGQEWFADFQIKEVHIMEDVRI